MKPSHARHALAVLILVLALAASADDAQRPAQARPDDPPVADGGAAGGPDAIVPINGPAYWGSPPTGPNFAGVRRTRFQPRNPTRAALAASRAQRAAFMDQASTPENIQVSVEGRTSGAARPVTDFSEVMLAVDPTDPDHLLGASKFFHTPASYGFFTGVFESFDGGLAWTQEEPPGVEQYSLTSDPVTTFDQRGNGYFTLLTRGPTGLDMLKKPAGGAWERPVVVDRTTVTDKQWIVADQDWQEKSPFAGNVYMSWTDVQGGRIVLARSTDGNATWSPLVPLASGELQGSIPAVGPDGTVYVVYGRDIFGGVDGTIEWVKSADGGRTFTPPATAARLRGVPFQLPNSVFRTPASLPAFAASTVDDSLFAAWSDYRNGDADAYLARSTDGGETWDEPIRLNDDPSGNGADQFQPQVAVAPNGRVAVMWFDRRLACPDLAWVPRDHVGRENFCVDTFMTRSFDGGETWEPNIRVSAQTWDPSVNLPMANATTGFIGDYQGLASTNDFDYPFWNATADLGRNPQHRQQIFLARVPAKRAPFDLSLSSLRVAPTVVRPGGTLTYTLTLLNSGSEDAGGVRTRAVLPVSTTLIAGSLDASSGLVLFDPDKRLVAWEGGVPTGGVVTVTYQVSLESTLADGSRVVHQAELTDGSGRVYRREARAAVSTPPTITSTRPDDGEKGVGVGTVIIVNFSEPMDPRSLVVSSFSGSPDPGGWEVAWARTQRSVSLRHANPFKTGQTYTVSVHANDVSGDPLVAGTVPNPWSFTTEVVWAAFLPWAAWQ